MAKRFTERRNNNTIRIWTSSVDYKKDELQQELSVTNDALAETDEEKLVTIRASGGEVTLDEYNSNLQDSADRISNIIDYWDYDAVVFTADEIISGYSTPISVESVSAEDVGNEAVLSIDEDNSTWWQSSTSGPHEIIYKFRDYDKRIIGFQIRRDNNDRSELTGLSVYVAKSLEGLDKAQNLGVSGVTLPIPADWNEIAFTKKQVGKYIRLTNFGSVQSGNEVRIREIQILTEPLENLE